MGNPPTKSEFGRSFLRRILGRLWRATGGRWYRRVDFWIMRRDLDTPDVPLPPGRDNPMKENESEFYLDHGTAHHVDLMQGSFTPEKIKHLYTCVFDDQIDMVVRVREDGFAWCYMMHASYPLQDPEYGFRIPIVEGRDILQFDGWVNPQYRGLMIGILGTNCANRMRRAEGFERLYATVRKADRRSARLHERMGFKPAGEIHHLRLGGLRFNRLDWLPGQHPEKDSFGKKKYARLRHPLTNE